MSLSISPRSLHRWLAMIAVPVVLAGCGSVDAVQTQEPESATYEGEEAEPERTVPLVITLEAGDGTLPGAISRFHFRIMEIHVLAGDTTSWSRDAGRYEFAVPRTGADPAMLVQTHVRPAEIRGVVLEIDRPYAEFGPNAGGPMTVRGSDSVRVALTGTGPPEGASGSSYAVRLRFQTARSIERDEQCRWHFTPRITGRVATAESP